MKIMVFLIQVLTFNKLFIKFAHMKYVIKIIHGKKYFVCKNTNQIINSKKPFKNPEIRKFNKIETVMKYIAKMRFWKDKKIIITRNDGREFKLEDAKIVCKLLDK